MKRQTIKFLAGGLCLALALTGCSSSKHAVKTAVDEETAVTVSASEAAANAVRDAVITKIEERGTAYEAVTAKVNLTWKMSGKSPVKLGGTLRIRRGQVVQLSVTYLLGIEVGRLEISPDGLLVIDRVNKRYVEVPFSELSQMAHTNLDYYTLQALFLNELFLPGQSAVSGNDAPSFTVTVDGDEATLAVKDTKTFEYQFLTRTSDSALKRSRIGYQNTAYALNWEYDDFSSLTAGYRFPCTMQVDFEGSSKPVSLTLELSKLGTDPNWETRTQVSSKYEKVAWKDILNQLMKL